MLIEGSALFQDPIGVDIVLAELLSILVALQQGHDLGVLPPPICHSLEHAEDLGPFELLDEAVDLPGVSQVVAPGEEGMDLELTLVLAIGYQLVA